MQDQLLVHREGEVLVRFRPGVSSLVKDTIRAGQGVRKTKQLRGESGFEKLELLNGRDAKTATLELLLNPQVEFAEPNFLISKDELTPNDPQFNEQWALRNSGQSGGQYGADINASGAWETTTGSSATVVAVIDSGVDFTHPDLKNNQWTNLNPSAGGDLHGWDYISETGVIKDEQGHGTAVAGIIAAEGNNSLGITGVMWRSSLMSLRVLDNTGTGDVASAVEAIDYAVTHGAQVINLSFGTAAESIALKDAIQRAIKRNVIVVCSAGNSGRNLSVTPYYPASFALKGLIAVAASDNSDQLSSWSNWDAEAVAVAAPGTNILTTRMGGGYWNVTGTSAAAPVVSGIAGLLKTIRRSTNAQLMFKAITSGVRQSASLAGKVSSGGVVNAADAIAKLKGASNQSPPFFAPGYGSGGDGPGGSFSTTPPPTSSAPISNLPNLDQIRKEQPQQPKARTPIEANLPCADCDPQGGGGGGGNSPSGDPNFSTARRRPVNETGEAGVDLGSRNFNWSLGLVSLAGRAGLDLDLVLTYNSLVWTRDGSFIKFNADFGAPAPGFRLGLPILQQRFLNSQTGIYAYMMVTPSGSRVELRQIGTSNIYESQDSAYTHLDVTDPNAPMVRTTDGTQFIFTPVTVNSEFRCTKIRDRNGNYISATYNTTNGHLLSITDTLGRVITFVYNGDNNLQTIRQTWAGVNHDWATFSYGQVFVAPAFGGGLLINGPNNNYATVLTQVSLHDGSYFTFQYNAAFAQVNRINHYAADAHLLNYTSYNVSSSSGQTECPRFTEQRKWAENWNNSNEAVTSYSVAADGSWTQQTAPDGTIYKEFFATSGWQSGLTTSTEIWSGGVKKKWTTVAWTQDDTSLSYQKNPRVTETNVYDPEGNRRRVAFTYYSTTYFSLPMGTYEYAADGVTLLRRTHTNYNLSSVYTDRRIIGLPSGQYVFDGNDTLYKFDVFDYDYGGASLIVTPQPAVQHDSAYGLSFVAGRGNLSLIRHADAHDPGNGQWRNTVFGYNTTGSMTSITDHLWRQTTISYSDSFSDGVNRNTFAYPTSITNADGFQKLTKYNFDFSGVTWTQTPSPNAGQAAPTQTITYDSAARLQQVTSGANGAYIRWFYPTSADYVQTFRTIVAGAGEAYSVDFFDGAGRVRAKASDHPGSTGLYSAQHFIYNNMGRLVQQSNPTEINAGGVPTGDDSAWFFTVQAYDWKGRPTLTTLPDGATRENTYSGCSCSGGEVITVRDERGRRRKLTIDVLGRLKQLDELNWDQSIYATTTYTYNVRDQLTSINQAGQMRTFTYDGRGRLQSRTTPEQGTTTYSYYGDDTVQSVTDARGSTTTFSYNNRLLVTGISYGVPPGVAATSNVTFSYDAAGNRTTMTDGLGSLSYVYDPLSQLTSETRTFSGVGSYTLSYSYNLGGELTSITNQWGAQVGYNYDKIGRPTSVSGSGYGGLSSYVTNMAHRSFALKQVSYGNGRTLSMQYDNRLRPTQWNVPGVMGWNYAYQYFGENTGRLTYAQNLNDPTLDRSFHYDAFGRLQSSFTGSAARAHVGIGGSWLSDGPYAMHDNVYDVWGNMTSRTGWGGTNPQYTASFTNNKMNGMVYDAAGNLTNAGGGWTFTYDAMGQQTTSAVGNVQMIYDGDRLRGKKSENGVVTYYLRSSVLGGQVVAEINSGVWSRGYVYLGRQTLAVQQGGVYWVHEDPLVKSKRVTDGSGSVVSMVELDPWGGETNRSSNEAFQPRKFSTYERDGNAADDAMHRRYDRWWGRFEQPDPYSGSYNLANPQSFNRYSFVQSDPVNLIDPTGLDPNDPPSTTHIDPATGQPVAVPGINAGTITITGSSSSGTISGSSLFGGESPTQLLLMSELYLFLRASQTQGFDPCTAVIAQFPTSGQGYYTYGLANERYGQNQVVSTLVNFASAWNVLHPDNPMGVGDISLRGGGDIQGHFEHEQGLQVDIRPMRNDNINGPTNFNAANYSFDLTNELVQGLRVLNNVVSVRFNDPNIQGTVIDANRYDRLGHRLPGVHDNHLHVTFQSATPCPVN